MDYGLRTGRSDDNAISALKCSCSWSWLELSLAKGNVEIGVWSDWFLNFIQWKSVKWDLKQSPINYKLHFVRVCMCVELKMWHFKYILEVDASDLVGSGVQCACEHMLDYTNNPENILTLMLHSFIKSLSNFRFCQIRYQNINWFLVRASAWLNTLSCPSACLSIPVSFRVVTQCCS